MLEKIKGILRISDDDFNIEITGLINACKADLKLAGIVKDSDTDPLIERAISIYCKANFGIDNPDFDKYNTSYNMLKNHLAVSKEYTTEEVIV